MSRTRQLSVHDSSVGTTRLTPLPERVGAKAMTCSGPSCRSTFTRIEPFQPPTTTPTLPIRAARRSEEHTSALQSLMRVSYAVFCLKKKNTNMQLNKYTPYTYIKILIYNSNHTHNT